MLNRTIVTATVATVALMGVVGTGTAVALDKTLTLAVGSDVRQVSAFGIGQTVSDVLRTNGVTLEGRDTVTPALDTRVSDGQTITVTVIRPSLVSITRDGVTTTTLTYETTVSGALRALGITVDADDRLSAAADSAITDGIKVAVKRVEVTQVAETAPVPFESRTVNDATIAKGTTKVTTPGVPGTVTRTYTVTTVDGVEESRALASEAVTQAPVAQVTTVGTKVVPAPAPATTGVRVATSGTAINLANEAMWVRVAQCESGNRWNINTGNGYYGGLQFSYSTWLAYGGADFAPRADLATREQQITVANRVYARNGLRDWACKA